VIKDPHDRKLILARLLNIKYQYTKKLFLKLIKNLTIDLNRFCLRKVKYNSVNGHLDYAKRLVSLSSTGSSISSSVTLSGILKVTTAGGYALLRGTTNTGTTCKISANSCSVVYIKIA
jgi:hypothetical protein